MEPILVTEGAPLSQMERVVDTFVAPSKTFTDILRSRSWWLPFIIAAVMSYALGFGIQQKVGWPQLVDNEIHAQPKTEEKLASVPPAQAATQHKIMAYSYQGTFYAFPVISLLSLLVFAVVLWPTINFVFAGKSTFGEVFAMLNYAFLPAVVKTLITVVVLFAGGAGENFTLENMLGTSPGYFIDAPGPLKTFLTSFDIFTLWSMVLMAIGLSIVGKTKRSSGYIAVFGWWLLIVLVKTGFAAVSGS